MISKIKQTSLQRVLLSSFIYILLISMCLFMAFSVGILFKRIHTSTQNLLKRSITIAWQVYNRFFDEEKAFLAALATQEATRSSVASGAIDDELVQSLNEKNLHDFWLVADSRGAVLATNLRRGKPLPQSLEDFIKDVVSIGYPMGRTDVFLLSETSSFPEELAERAVVKVRDENEIIRGDFPYVLVQLAGAPVRNESNAVVGCLVAGRVLNNDTSIADAYSRLVPNSFLTIGVEGIRVEANLKGIHDGRFIGMRQPKELTEAVKAGKNYVGASQIEPRDIHLFTTEPLPIASGKTYAALSVGIPSYGVTTIKRDTLITMSLALLVCLSISVMAVTMISRRFSRPIARLSQLANKISHQETITEDHLEQLKVAEESHITEIDHLYDCFKNMTIALYQKCKENEAYMEELEQDRIKLHILTEELMEANTHLEKRVEERTEELRKAVQELKTLNHLKTQFLANMSHELRTPLHSIIGFAEMLYDELYGELNQMQKDYIAIILSSAKHLLEIISDILDLSCIESDKITLYKEEVAIEDLIKSVVTIMKPQADEKKLDLTIKTAEALPRIYADPSRVKQVLSNLLSNAIKFTPEGGSITIEAFQNGDEIGVTVSDTGIGIKEEHQKNVFNEFYQCEDPYKRRFEGVGLGLPLSKKLVELHGGRIELESKYGVGTKVTFFLPIIKEPYEEKEKEGLC
ncbi:MAG: ATP-binding protein [Thermacetogeniaceae bacterium]